MGNFGSYETAIDRLKNKEMLLKSQLSDAYITPITLGIISGIELSIAYINELLIDEIRILETNENKRPKTEEREPERL